LFVFNGLTGILVRGVRVVLLAGLRGKSEFLSSRNCLRRFRIRNNLLAAATIAWREDRVSLSGCRSLLTYWFCAFLAGNRMLFSLRAACLGVGRIGSACLRRTID
jgi:hypothetical protein